MEIVQCTNDGAFAALPKASPCRNTILVNSVPIYEVHNFDKNQKKQLFSLTEPTLKTLYLARLFKHLLHRN
jgi:hypothetical protein